MKTLKYKLALKIRYKLAQYVERLDQWIQDEDNAVVSYDAFCRQRKQKPKYVHNYYRFDRSELNITTPGSFSGFKVSK